MALIRLLILAGFLMVGCTATHRSGTNKVGAEGVGSEVPSSLPIDNLLQKPSQIVLKDVNFHVLSNHCVDCHGGSKGKKAGISLNGIEAMVEGKGSDKITVVPFSPDRSSVYTTLNATGAQHMPPLAETQLTEDQRNLVFQWIKNGAPTEVGEKVERPKSLAEELKPFFDNPETIDFNVINKQILTQSCNDCHSQNGHKKDSDAISYGADTTDFDSLLNNFFVTPIVPGNHEESFFYDSVAGAQSMPPPADGYEPLNAYKVKLLRLWILNCAIEDYSKVKDSDKLDPSEDDPEKVRDCEEPEEE